MKGRALLVPRERGEEMRRRLRDAGLLRADLAIRREGAVLALPIVDTQPVPEGLGELTEREFEPSRPSMVSDYRDLLDWPEPERGRLPRSFDVVGDIVLVRVPVELGARANEIGAALLEFVPGARIVGRDGGVHGVARRRSIERIAGTGGWSTRHRENGLEVEVDLERAYFSPRLAGEHARVAAEVRPGDRVYDLCCGVGPFSLAIARDGRATRVTGVDSNPEAIALLERSRSRVANGDRITGVVSDVVAFASAAAPVERVIFNLPREGIKYVPSVARTVARQGRLYYYEVTPRTGFERRGEEIVSALRGPDTWALVAMRVVHPYSPSEDLVAFVLERRAAG
jgi:tRNA (guanine37-N1)-methyltransferase